MSFVFKAVNVPKLLTLAARSSQANGDNQSAVVKRLQRLLQAGVSTCPTRGCPEILSWSWCCGFLPSLNSGPVDLFSATTLGLQRSTALELCADDEAESGQATKKTRKNKDKKEENKQKKQLEKRQRSHIYLLSHFGPWNNSLNYPSESRYVLRKGLPLHSYSKDGIGTLNPIIGRGLDSWGMFFFSNIPIPKILKVLHWLSEYIHVMLM